MYCRCMSRCNCSVSLPSLLAVVCAELLVEERRDEKEEGALVSRSHVFSVVFVNHFARHVDATKQEQPVLFGVGG